jgi:hypothetical protein
VVPPRGRFQLLLFFELTNVADELLNLSVGQLVLISRHFLVLAVRCGINQLSLGLLLHFIGTEVPGCQFLSCRRISASVRTVTRCTLRLEQAGSILLRSRRQGENKGGRSQQKRGGDCSNKQSLLGRCRNIPHLGCLMLFQSLERLAEGEGCRTLIHITHSIQANAADPRPFGLRGATVEHFTQGMHLRKSLSEKIRHRAMKLNLTLSSTPTCGQDFRPHCRLRLKIVRTICSVSPCPRESRTEE